MGFKIEANNLVAWQIREAVPEAVIRTERTGGTHVIIHLSDLDAEQRRAILAVIGGERYAFRLKKE